MESETYVNLAKYYDAAYRVKEGPNLTDVPFYVDQARQYGGPILEMACGTGRVLLEIARIGIEIVGVDLSTDMLSILHTKLATESDEVQRRVSLYEGDMRSVSLG